VSLDRQVKQKSYETAIEAARLLKERGHSFRWYVFGEGEERADLENRIKDAALENEFILFGSVRNPFPYLREAQIYVQCSKFEGQSIAVREAKVLGMPIVLSLSSGNHDQLTDGVDGIYVGTDALSVADGIERLITDPKLRQRLGEAAAKSNQEHEDAVQLLQLINE
jgi:glycosyltransferase involved in cell wall biosynthesis